MALLAVPLLAVGCGSSDIETGETVHPGVATVPHAHAITLWTGLGAKLPDWESAHPRGTEGCSAGKCFGPKIQIGPNEAAYEFVTLETTPDNRVDGYTQNLGEGQIEAAAKAAVRQLLPHDTRTLQFFINHQNGSCAIWNIRSATLARWFALSSKVGDPQGIMSVDLHTHNANGESEWNPEKVSIAGVSLGPSKHGENC